MFPTGSLYVPPGLTPAQLEKLKNKPKNMTLLPTNNSLYVPPGLSPAQVQRLKAQQYQTQWTKPQLGGSLYVPPGLSPAQREAVKTKAPGQASQPLQGNQGNQGNMVYVPGQGYVQMNPSSKSVGQIKMEQKGYNGYWTTLTGEKLPMRLGPNGEQQWQVKGMSGMMYWVDFDPTQGAGGKMTYLPTDGRAGTTTQGSLKQSTGGRLMNRTSSARGGGGGGYYTGQQVQNWYSNLVNWRI